jgi:hypothetical protein
MSTLHTPDLGEPGAVRILVSHYEAGQLALCKSLDPRVFTPWNVEFNRSSRLLEFDLFREMVREWPQHVSHLGLFSWKFLRKSGLDQDLILHQIHEGVEQADEAIILNPAISSNAVFKNVFEQGQVSGHASMAEIASRMGLQAYAAELLPHDTFAMCSYVVGTRRFWREYMGFLQACLNEATSRAFHDRQFASMYHGSAGYFRNPYLDYRPFFVERLLQVFLSRTHLQYRYIEPDARAFQQKFLHHSDQVQDLYRLKQSAKVDSAARSRWFETRQALMARPGWLTTVLAADDPEIPRHLN